MNRVLKLIYQGYTDEEIEEILMKNDSREEKKKIAAKEIRKERKKMKEEK